MTEELLNEIEEFLTAQDLAPSTFGFRAVNDGKLVSRLQNGGQVLPKTAKRIREFMYSHSRISAGVAAPTRA